MDHLENHRHVDGVFRWGESPDTTKLGGPGDFVLGWVKLEMSYVSYPLRFFKSGVALL
jgi:hypothetical protein